MSNTVTSFSQISNLMFPQVRFTTGGNQLVFLTEAFSPNTEAIASGCFPCSACCSGIGIADDTKMCGAVDTGEKRCHPEGL